MRWVVCVMLVLVACKEGRAPAHDPPVQPGSAAAPASSDDAWKRIEALATPTTTPGPSTELERALPLAAANKDAWRELEYRRPPPSLSEYPQGPEAVAALKAWFAAKGGLPAIGSPIERGPMTMSVYSLGSTAVATATTRDELSPAIYLGTLLVTHGRNLLEVQMGASVLSRAASKDRMLASDDAKHDPVPVPALDLVRVFAAEATHQRAMLDWSLTTHGKQEMGSALERLGSDSRALAKDVFGKEPEALIPTADEAAAYKAYWLAALDGAQRGEPASTTIERARKAAVSAPASIKDTVTRIADIAELIQGELDRAANPPY